MAVLPLSPCRGGSGRREGIGVSRSWTPASSVVCAAVLVCAFSAGPTAPQASAATSSAAARAARADIDARSAFGLPVDSDTMRLISQPGVDVGSGVWGIPLSAAEEKALDLSGRMAFAEAVSEDLLPFAKSLPSYGGAWIDQLAGGGLVVALTDVAPASWSI